ncbi:hypothetical protein CVT24_006887 [Panaeolus cyanescens]|uniref:Amidohydrolase 3 domain-containing protein n=1 Tax=Panaeolus cyanescens TaxID=181874 RepID=A0A409W068_9AGAR|nr:hypothetical protein CVT24_006887 [Panaeolus cyanescens]
MFRTDPKPASGIATTPAAPQVETAATAAPIAPKKPSSLLTMPSWSTRLRYGIVAVALLAYYTRQPSDYYAVCSSDGEKAIYTVDANNSVVQCMLVHGPDIVDTGDLESIKQRNPRLSFGTRHIPRGSIVVPGISDSHCHILEYGASSQIPLSEGKNVKETVHAIRDYILSNPDLANNKSKVVEGWGWDHASWDVEKWPTYEGLEQDPVVGGRPIVLQSRDGHALWVSKATLQANAPYPDEIEGGFILRDQEGNPTGIFIDGAQALIKRDPPTDADLKRRFQITVDHALAAGLTSLHDAGFKPDSLAFFKRQIQQDNLPLRIYGMTHFNETDPNWGQEIDPVLRSGKNRLTVRSVKIFADGDRANGIVLDAFELGMKGTGQTTLDSLRPRLEHAQIMNPKDIARLGKLGVIASIQPTHAISDMWYAEERLGPERVKDLYAFRSIIDSGARVTLGSDFPVEVINPLKGFYAAVTRLETDGSSPHGPGGWFPNQRLTRLEALRGMTIDPAYASFTESSLGSLEKGKLADYAVLSQDIMSVPVEEIMKTKVLATVIDGNVVHGVLG